MKQEHGEQTSELIERDSLSHESWKGKFNFKYLYNLFHNSDKDNSLYVIVPFFKQTSLNKVYLKKIIFGTSNVDRSPPTFTYPVQKDTLFKKLNIRKSKIVYPVETQGFENHILFRDPWGQIREYPPPPSLVKRWLQDCKLVRNKPHKNKNKNVKMVELTSWTDKNEKYFIFSFFAINRIPKYGF